MKLICPNCHYQRPVDASADARLSLSCARCGTPLEQLLWTGSQSSPLQTTTTAASAAAAPMAVVDQGIMENQNAYAPSAEPLGEDVLEIPRPLRSTPHAGEQMLVLEDVIPVPTPPELSPSDEGIDPQMHYGVASESDTLPSDEDDDDETTLVSPSAAALDLERTRLAGTDVFVGAKASAPDYEGYRAWVRIAPLLILLAALAFFSLYYLGNRMGDGGRDTGQNTATSPATQPETQTAAPTATSPQSVESAPPQSAQPSESSVVGASADTQKPVEKSKVETAKTEAPPAAPAAAPAPAVVTAPSTSSSPATDQSVGNFTVQVGSYNDAAQAEERAGRLRSSGIEARVVRAEIPRRGTWYRVQAGRFASQEEASRYAAEIKGKGATDDFIITAVQ